MWAALRGASRASLSSISSSPMRDSSLSISLNCQLGARHAVSPDTCLVAVGRVRRLGFPVLVHSPPRFRQAWQGRLSSHLMRFMRHHWHARGTWLRFGRLAAGVIGSVLAGEVGLLPGCTLFVAFRLDLDVLPAAFEPSSFP